MKGNVVFVVTPCTADDYRVALFITVLQYAGTTYICKPYETQPLTTIANDGSWTTSYATGGLDVYAEGLVKPGFTWPCFTSTLPSVDGNTVLAVAKATR
ncbi:MAG TPA: hypothetical protein VMW75_23130 [Thermoanaerobaculia bacterium]|nr:hypothetical protein [Thermoanaerobaculia bacterium]